MLKYARVVSDNGMCEVGIGTDEEFYKSMGMTLLDVEQSEVDERWYLTEKCPHHTQEQKDEILRQEVGMLSMTKLDFYKLVLKPNGITYSRLKQILATDEEMEACWDLCEKVYRGDDVLCKAIEMYLPDVDLDQVFKEKGAYD